jgi:hypothetical protein
MAEPGVLEKQSCLTSAMIRMALSGNRVLAGVARSGARAELSAEAGGSLSSEHGPGRAGNVVAIGGPHSTRHEREDKERDRGV